jgi:hypothetical protein
LIRLPRRKIKEVKMNFLSLSIVAISLPFSALAQAGQEPVQAFLDKVKERRCVVAFENKLYSFPSAVKRDELDSHVLKRLKSKGYSNIEIKTYEENHSSMHLELKEADAKYDSSMRKKWFFERRGLFDGGSVGTDKTDYLVSFRAGIGFIGDDPLVVFKSKNRISRVLKVNYGWERSYAEKSASSVKDFYLAVEQALDEIPDCR